MCSAGFSVLLVDRLNINWQSLITYKSFKSCMKQEYYTFACFGFCNVTVKWFSAVYNSDLNIVRFWIVG